MRLVSSMEFNKESDRLSTFYSWKKTFIDVSKLACLGMFYVGPCDRVKCYFCGVDIFNWEPTDDELGEHLRFSPQCPLLRQCSTTNNIPINHEFLRSLLASVGEDECGCVEIRPEAVSEGGIGSPTWSYETRDPFSLKYPAFARHVNRVASFDSGIEGPGLQFCEPTSLASAGFFNKDGKIVCFCCGQDVTKWLALHNNPIDIHLYLKYNCEYITQMCRINFFNTMTAVHRNLAGSFGKKPRRDATSTAFPSNLSECPKCFRQAYLMPFNPCGHALLCIDCSVGQIMCIECGQPASSAWATIENNKNIHYM